MFLEGKGRENARKRKRREKRPVVKNERFDLRRCARTKRGK